MSARLIVTRGRLGVGVCGCRDALQQKRLANPGLQGKVDWWNMSTPDFVFRKRVTIGGRTVRWLDLKNLYLPMHAGGTTRQKVDRMVTQANRYNNDWGPGGFVFQVRKGPAWV
jgi:hypothetical protein